MKKRKYQSEILMVIHQDMEAFYEAGGITTEEMRHFDEACLAAEPGLSSAESSAHRNKPVIPACANPRV